MKALIIDDERLARNELRRLLRDFPDIEIVGEAGGADEARPQIASAAPDLIFLDIEMPGPSGLELAAALPPEAGPLIIFTTAYENYAWKAFEVEAVDYLLKPIAQSRLAAALERARTLQRDDTPRTDAPLTPTDRVLIRGERTSNFIQVGDIRRLESVGNYTEVHFDTRKELVYRSLAAVQKRLPDSFFRVSRQTIVNLTWVDQVEDWFSGGLRLHLRGGKVVEVSRRRAQLLRKNGSL